MRRKLIIGATAGALALTGVGLAVPALADPDGGDGSSAVQRINDALSGLVSDGSITQDQADEVATRLSQAGIGGRGGPRDGGMGLDSAARALGMTEDELRTALATDGTTLADVAKQQGVPVDTLIDALLAAAQKHIAQEVAKGDLTQQRADARLADLKERITERVNSEAPSGRGPGPHGHPGGPADQDGDLPPAD